MSVNAVRLTSYFFARVVQDGQRGRLRWRVRPAAADRPVTSGAPK